MRVEGAGAGGSTREGERGWGEVEGKSGEEGGVGAGSAVVISSSDVEEEEEEGADGGPPSGGSGDNRGGEKRLGRRSGGSRVNGGRVVQVAAPGMHWYNSRVSTTYAKSQHDG